MLSGWLLLFAYAQLYANCFRNCHSHIQFL